MVTVILDVFVHDSLSHIYKYWVFLFTVLQYFLIVSSTNMYSFHSLFYFNCSMLLNNFHLCCLPNFLYLHLFNVLKSLVGKFQSLLLFYLLNCLSYSLSPHEEGYNHSFCLLLLMLYYSPVSSCVRRSERPELFHGQ